MVKDNNVKAQPTKVVEPTPKKEVPLPKKKPVVDSKNLPDAVPLLPKQTNYVSGPPKCPLDFVKFI